MIKIRRISSLSRGALVASVNVRIRERQRDAYRGERRACEAGEATRHWKMQGMEFLLVCLEEM